MQALRRGVSLSGARPSTSRLPVSQSARLQCRGTRAESSSHGTGHDSSHGHAHSTAPATESFSTTFYFALAAIPTALLLLNYSASTADSPSYITRVIEGYAAFGDRWTRRNTMHTNLVEQAAYDRNLFQSSPGSSMIELKFPEIFNTGSPFNVVAGQGGANLDKLIAHYEEKNREVERKRAEALAKRAQEE